MVLRLDCATHVYVRKSTSVINPVIKIAGSPFISDNKPNGKLDVTGNRQLTTTFNKF